MLFHQNSSLWRVYDINAQVNNNLNNPTTIFQSEGILDLSTLILNSISMLTTLLVLIIALLMRLYDKKLVDRVSLRLSIAISITNFLAAVSLETIAFIQTNCEIVAFVFIWLQNQYLLFSVAIAFNLQYLFLHKKTFNPAIEKWYYILSIGLSLLSASIQLAASRFGWDKTQTLCWYSASRTTLSQKLEYCSYIIPVIVYTVYCLIVAILVAVKLKLEAREMERQTIQDFKAQGCKGKRIEAELAGRSKIRQAINCVVRRILLYPVVPFITQTGFIVSNIYTSVYKRPDFGLNSWSFITSVMPGLCNFIAFTLDPAVSIAFSRARLDLIDKYGDFAIAADTDSFFAVRPDLSKACRRKGLMPWFVRTFLLSVSKKPSSVFAASTIMSYSDGSSSRVDVAARLAFNPRFDRSSHVRPGEAILATPPRAYSLAGESIVEMTDIHLDEHATTDSSEPMEPMEIEQMAEVQRMMVGL
ncbi:hypothetical protein BC937DRAFT_90558 [Endogone sp. FLAS-F59071]|nr:hypothetical protein BC937DRAFT_90558 [Endogone sp. FLAS-F59071]|eukprot:RUS16994.1 hypothetical protein BC937DRAFT_90558 [Endogone sp. FLAS-F59071]